MATPAAVLSILVKADTKAAQAALVKTDRSLKTTAGRMDSVDKASKRSNRGFAAIKTGAIAAGGGLVIAGLAAKKAFAEFEEAEKATKQTRAVLKSTGDAAKVTAAEVENLAQKLSLKSGIDDEAIQSGENLLLTFTKIRNETGKGNQIFTRATSTIVDMSAALGQDLKNSAIQVGKALQDPEKGITALRRVGVAFTAQQEDRIQKWVEEGQILRAQRRILKELTVEFGGSAAAQATGADKLRVAFDNLFESFGKAFGPSLQKGFERLAGGLQKVGDIISNPKLTNAEKFGRIMDMVVRQIEKALPKVSEAGAKIAAALAEGVLKAWIGMSPLAKLFTIGALLRVIGGRGAVIAAGGAIGKMFGAAFGTSAATAVGPGAKTAGAKGGMAFLGGFRGILGKLGVAGLVAAIFGPELYKAIKDAGTHADAAGAEFEFAAERMRKLQKAGNMTGLLKAARDARITAKSAGEAGAPLKALADRYQKIGETAIKTGEKTKWLQDRFKNMREGASRSVTELKNRVEFNMQTIRQTMDRNTDKGREAITENFRSAAKNVRLSMKAGTISVKEGTALIRKYLVEAWTTMGFSKADAVALMSRVKGSAQTPKDGELRPNQRGSYINAGKPVGDSVPSILERGEYVLNRNAVKKVGRQNLDQLNFQNAPRFARGGMAGMIGAANQLEQAGFPYVWGGGHSATPAPFGPMDCSGAVSYVLQHGGVNIPTMTSGSMMSIGQPGPGPVTIFANVGHVLMRLGNRFFGTSNSNPGGGAGWIDPAPSASYLAGFVQRSFDAKGGGMFTGDVPKIPKVEATGPDGLVKGVVQGALNVTRKVAQAGVNKVARSMESMGGGDPGSFTDLGGSGRKLMEAISRERGWNFADWWALDAAESSHGANLANPDSTARLRGQFLDMNYGRYGPGSDPAQNPSMREQIISMARYIQERYGNPSAAWAFHQGHNYYGKGGLVGMAAGGPTVSAAKGPAKGKGKGKGDPATLAKQLYRTLKTIRGSDKKKVRSKALTGLLKRIGGIEVPGSDRIKQLQADTGMYGEFADRALSLSAEPDTTALQNLPVEQLRALAGAHMGAMTQRQRALIDLGGGRGVDQLDDQSALEILGTPVWGQVGGKTQVEWLEKQFETLRVLRNALIKAEQQIVARRQRVMELIEQAQKRLEEVAEQIREAGNTKRRLENAFEKVGNLSGPGAPEKARNIVAGLKGDIPDGIWKALKHAVGLAKPAQELKKELKQQIDAVEGRQGPRVRERGALENRIIPALVGRRDALTEALTNDVRPSLTEVQGSVVEEMRTKLFPNFGGYQSAAASGGLGGQVFDVHMSLRELGIRKVLSVPQPEVAGQESESAELLKELLRQANLRTAVAERQFDVFKNFPVYSPTGVPFGGQFHTGGVVPGPVGAESATILQGGEGVFTRDQMAAMGAQSVTINVAPGMEWLKQFISVEVGKNTRLDARLANRGLPGRGGGGIR